MGAWCGLVQESRYRDQARVINNGYRDEVRDFGCSKLKCSVLAWVQSPNALVLGLAVILAWLGPAPICILDLCGPAYERTVSCICVKRHRLSGLKLLVILPKHALPIYKIGRTLINSLESVFFLGAVQLNIAFNEKFQTVTMRIARRFDKYKLNPNDTWNK